ncbi:MAG TPA: NRDE family protein [Burkholderiaceae bacterium]|nr:NRDE family protein [Burkholderiaceae bacterium]
MCLVALALDSHPRFPLVIAANRDEFFDRAAAPLGWWRPRPGGAQILAGRDLHAGGTWMGLTREGRFALLTNVRDPARHDPAAPSRGGLVTDWLIGGQTLQAFHEAHAGVAYNGFNLLAGDGREIHWWSNHPAASRENASSAESPCATSGDKTPFQRLEPGIHGLSNALLDTPWPKVTRLQTRVRAALTQALSANALIEDLFDALADPTPAPDDALPRTGVSVEWERWLSPAYIRTPDGRYGTRCSTVLVVEHTGSAARATVVERTHPPYPSSGGRPVEQRHELADWPRRFSTPDQPA